MVAGRRYHERSADPQQFLAYIMLRNTYLHEFRMPADLPVYRWLRRSNQSKRAGPEGIGKCHGVIRSGCHAAENAPIANQYLQRGRSLHTLD